MSTDRETTRLVRSWLEEGVTALPDRVLDAVLDQVPATPQRRSWWPARRSTQMTRFFIAASAAAAVLVTALVGYNLLPGVSGPGARETPVPTDVPTGVPTASPVAFRDGSLAAGTYVITPFSGMPNESTVCMPQASGCTENPADDSIRVTFTVPNGYTASGQRPLIFGPDGNTGLIFLRGSNLYSDPCHSTPPPDIEVGPTVDDFANAIAAHPLLDATTPVDVTLAGYSGKYLDLPLPADIASCTPNAEFWPFEPGVYAQGSSHRWHLWILDVEGIRVVVQSMDYATTPPQQIIELQAIVDSIEIDPR